MKFPNSHHTWPRSEVTTASRLLPVHRAASPIRPRCMYVCSPCRCKSSAYRLYEWRQSSTCSSLHPLSPAGFRQGLQIDFNAAGFCRPRCRTAGCAVCFFGTLWARVELLWGLLLQNSVCRLKDNVITVVCVRVCVCVCVCVCARERARARA